MKEFRLIDSTPGISVLIGNGQRLGAGSRLSLKAIICNNSLKDSLKVKIPLKFVLTKSVLYEY